MGIYLSHASRVEVGGAGQADGGRAWVTSTQVYHEERDEGEEEAEGEPARLVLQGEGGYCMEGRCVRSSCSEASPSTGVDTGCHTTPLPGAMHAERWGAEARRSADCGTDPRRCCPPVADIWDAAWDGVGVGAYGNRGPRCWPQDVDLPPAAEKPEVDLDAVTERILGTLLTKGTGEGAEAASPPPPPVVAPEPPKPVQVAFWKRAIACVA